MTALKELQMEQRIMELEAKVGEAAECIYQLTEMLDAQQKQIDAIQTSPSTELPKDVAFRNICDVKNYMKRIGFEEISDGLYMNAENTIKATVGLCRTNYRYWEIKFSRV